MFVDTKPVKFEAGKFDVLGQHNTELETNDYCCITLWSSCNRLMRYTRLKDVTLRVPPLKDSQKFHIGHDAKRLYYIG